MGHRADELILHLLGLFQPLGHLVDGAAQAVHLVAAVAGHGQADIQFAPRDAGSGAFHLPQRDHDAAHEIQTGRHRKAQNDHHHHDADEDDALQLVLDEGQARDEPHGRHVFGRIGHQTADGHDHLIAGGTVDGHPHAVGVLLRPLKVNAAQDALGIGAAG